jgi:hypothetical protein
MYFAKGSGVALGGVMFFVVCVKKYRLAIGKIIGYKRTDKCGAYFRRKAAILR